MDQVSQIIDDGIKSEYLSINYRPSMDKSNFNLNLNCSSLLLAMALADITRKEEQINSLKEKFIEALSECKTEEEIKNFAKFMEEMAKVGGYAKEFYSSNISLLNQNGVMAAKNKLGTIKVEKKNPVSAKTYEGIESAYFNVKYRPKGGLEELDAACSSLLTYMALADITREQKQINNLLLKFCEALTLCKTPEDFDNFKIFMDITADVGGYAIEFNNKVRGLINQNGKNRAQQLIDERESKRKTNAVRLEEFKKTFAHLNLQLTELKESRVIDNGEVAYLLKEYNELQSELYNFNGIVDKNFISQCDAKIEETITYLKDLYRNLEEVKKASMNL